MTATHEIHLTFRKTPRGKKGEFNALYTVTDTTGRDLCSTRTPLLSAARLLLQEGNDPASTIFMAREGETSWSLKAALGVSARLTVRENEKAGPIFAPCDAAALAELKAGATSVSG